MKTKIFKIVLPLIAIVFAIGGSFVSHASEKNVNAPVTAYINPIPLPPTGPCSVAVTCSNIVSPVVCSATYLGDTYQAYSKANPMDNFCLIVRYRYPE